MEFPTEVKIQGVYKFPQKLLISRAFQVQVKFKDYSRSSRRSMSPVFAENAGSKSEVHAASLSAGPSITLVVKSPIHMTTTN